MKAFRGGRRHRLASSSIDDGAPLIRYAGRFRFGHICRRPRTRHWRILGGMGQTQVTKSGQCASVEKTRGSNVGLLRLARIVTFHLHRLGAACLRLPFNHLSIVHCSDQRQIVLKKCILVVLYFGIFCVYSDLVDVTLYDDKSDR